MGIKGVFSDPLCKVCGESDPKKFYGKMKTTCNSCHKKLIERQRVKIREEAIDYKGGKCQHCGYDKYRGALEFHHIDPSEKEALGLRKWNRKKLYKELDKCVLLCANCHREEHARLRIGSVGELA
jgi:5-methylcytosine-specific restriction endonuclease McrA